MIERSNPRRARTDKPHRSTLQEEEKSERPHFSLFHLLAIAFVEDSLAAAPVAGLFTTGANLSGDLRGLDVKDLARLSPELSVVPIALSFGEAVCNLNVTAV